MRSIVWLASYPKCGNTWFRLLLANLERSEPADINAIETDEGIASARRRFDEGFLFSSGLLTHEECDDMRPALYRQGPAAGDRAEYRFLKTHDAWRRNRQGQWLLGGRDVARGAIVIVRDPRDVAASLANHLALDLDKTIDFMANADADLAGRRDRQGLQLRQRLLGWSGFYASWLDQHELSCHLLRYEDMQRDAKAALSRALDFLGMAVDAGAIARAVRFSAFDRLQQQEEQAGFHEAPVRTGEGCFFRKGTVGGWRDELTSQQVEAIEAAHAPMMRRLGYETVSFSAAKSGIA
jgi:hypothetical protein